MTTPDDVDEANLVDIRAQALRRLSEYSRQRWTYALNRFIAHLVHARVIAAAIEPAPAALDALCADYGAWLRTQRGSAPGTIKTYQGKLRRFLTFRFGSAAPGDLHAITRADIDAWFGTTGGRGARSKASSLRSLFPFLFATGRIDRNLALSVPRVAGTRSPLPIRHLSAEEVERVLAAARGGHRHRPSRPRNAADHGPARPARRGDQRHPARRHRLAGRRGPDPRQGRAKVRCTDHRGLARVVRMA
ncbi:MAG: hypothetical protein F4X36_22705 [Gammaproteobacteria bacterium]|nr:hypothetical protein [Gammaproteobacteria bacterium]